MRNRSKNLLTNSALRQYWSAVLCVCALAVSSPARAHELALDQVMLWPDPVAGVLRGELTCDPGLTRSADAPATPAQALRVVQFLNANLRLTVDGLPLTLGFEVRELWVRGGATLGDVVTFSAPLPRGSRELRVHASRAFRSLVVSVQRVMPSGEVDTTSWLVGSNEWTPAFRWESGWQQPGWRSGGPQVFVEAGLHPRSSELAARFVRLGFEHILPDGLDHVLFVAGLVLAHARRYRQVLISLSLFTLAHTLTLLLGQFEVWRVSPAIVEPLIALSIFAVGVDNLRARRSAESPATTRHLAVFCFGLVHGLGFAGALSELAFAREHVVLTAFSFNLGVELGQLVVVLLLGLMLHLMQRWRSLERYATFAGSAVIAAAGLLLVVDRALQDAEGAASPAAGTSTHGALLVPPLPVLNPSCRHEEDSPFYLPARERRLAPLLCPHRL